MITVEIEYTNQTVYKDFVDWDAACDYCRRDGDHCLDWNIVKDHGEQTDRRLHLANVRRVSP